MLSESINIYVPDERQVWVPAEIISKSEDGSYEMLVYDSIERDYCTTTVVTAEKASDEFMSSFPRRTDQFPDEGFENLSSLNTIHEANVLDNLELRFKAGQPYTNAGDVCIATNPYQWLDLYSEDVKYVLESEEFIG